MSSKQHVYTRANLVDLRETAEQNSNREEVASSWRQGLGKEVPRSLIREDVQASGGGAGGGGAAHSSSASNNTPTAGGGGGGARSDWASSRTGFGSPTSQSAPSPHNHATTQAVSVTKWVYRTLSSSGVVSEPVLWSEILTLIQEGLVEQSELEVRSQTATGGVSSDFLTFDEAAAKKKKDAEAAAAVPSPTNAYRPASGFERGRGRGGGGRGGTVTVGGGGGMMDRATTGGGRGGAGGGAAVSEPTKPTTPAVNPWKKGVAASPTSANAPSSVPAPAAAAANNNSKANDNNTHKAGGTVRAPPKPVASLDDMDLVSGGGDDGATSSSQPSTPSVVVPNNTPSSAAATASKSGATSAKRNNNTIKNNNVIPSGPMAIGAGGAVTPPAAPPAPLGVGESPSPGKGGNNKKNNNNSQQPQQQAPKQQQQQQQAKPQQQQNANNGNSNAAAVPAAASGPKKSWGKAPTSSYTLDAPPVQAGGVVGGKVIWGGAGAQPKSIVPGPGPAIGTVPAPRRSVPSKVVPVTTRSDLPANTFPELGSL